MAKVADHSAAPRYLAEERLGAPPDAPPPPYTEATEDDSGSPSTSATDPPSINRQFPPTFNLYLASNILSQRKFTLGEHQESPFYSVTTHTGFSGKEDVVLHTDKLSSSAPLATAHLKKFSSDIIINVPPLVGTGAGSDVRMRSGSWPKRSWSFSIQVAAGDTMRDEPFEWRHSSSEEVKSLAKGKWGEGWKLVHLGPGGSRDGTGPRAGDGNKVVAVFSVPSMAVTKKMSFRFLGTGESGAFGERWSVMAVTSALGIWEYFRRQKASASSA